MKCLPASAFLCAALPLSSLLGAAPVQSEPVPGYLLLAPLRSTETVLVDLQGEVVHRWESELTPGNAAVLLPNGNLLRSSKVGDNPTFSGGGEGGRLEEFTWDGKRVWTYDLTSESQLHHHDFEVLPNGNVLVLAWEHKSQREALLAGRRQGAVSEKGLWPDVVLELEPTRPSGAKVVWRWAAWDHLVQDRGADLPSYGSPAELPGRLDINIGAPALEREETAEERRERLETEAMLASMGYAGGDEDEPEEEPRGGGRDGADWMHSNSVSYQPDLDLIVISARNFSEVLVIDHSTTTEEARSSEGGRYGRGGDVLLRWGNPRNHGHPNGQQVLFGQHDARWTTEGGRVALTVFNNGGDRPGGEYSSVDLVQLPLLPSGGWVDGNGPCRTFAGKAAWTYRSPGDDFFSSHISGAVRLNADVFLVCEGADGRIFQVNREGEILWDYTIPKGLVKVTEQEERKGRGGGRRERGGRPEGGRGQGPPGGRRGPRGGQGISLFRAVHVPLDHPALAARK